LKPEQVLPMNVQLTAVAPCTIEKHAPSRVVSGPFPVKRQL
jgi:hypothetical protein